MKNISIALVIVALIFAFAMVKIANTLSSEISAAIIRVSEDRQTQVMNDDRDRYQIEIITDKGVNWNGIYVFDKKSGVVKFYASQESFQRWK